MALKNLGRARGYSAFEIAKKHNPDLQNEQQWLETLKGPKGDTGEQGEPGQNGESKTYEKFVVVGIWGQSNAVGYDESNLTLYDVSKDTARILQWGFGDNQLTPLGYCAKNHQDMNSSGVLRGGQQSVMANNRQGEPLNDPERFTNAKTKGVHLPLANLIIDEIPSDYGLIIVPAAYGGQSITTFLSGARINTFAQNIKRALDTHDNSVLAGIVWCQGENDTGSMNKDTYKNNFINLINNLKTQLAGYEKKSITGAVDASIWYNYEYPKRFKDNTYGWAILDAQKEVLGDRYTPIPDDVPVNLTQYCASNKPDHYAQDAFRTHIAPRLFNVMKKNGAFLSLAIEEEAAASSAEVDTDTLKQEIKDELSSQGFLTAEQAGDFAHKSDLAVTVGELTSFHLWYEERIAQLEDAVRNGTNDIRTILRMFDVSNDMLDYDGEWDLANGAIDYIGVKGDRTYSLVINADYDTVQYHNNVNAAYGVLVAYNESTGKYLWLYSDNNNVFMTDRNSTTAFTQQTNNTGTGTRNIVKQNTNMLIHRNGTVITGTNTSGTQFSIDIASNLAVLGPSESTKLVWGFAIGWSRTINKFDNSLPYWVDVKLSNQN